MNLLGLNHKSRKFLLPLLFMVAVCFISLGISIPFLASPQEAGLSTIHDAKPRPLVVVKEQIKSPQTRVVKASPVYDLAGKVSPISIPEFLVVFCRHQSCTHLSSLLSSSPARAPPA